MDGRGTVTHIRHGFYVVRSLPQWHKISGQYAIKNTFRWFFPILAAIINNNNNFINVVGYVNIPKFSCYYFYKHACGYYIWKVFFSSNEKPNCELLPFQRNFKIWLPATYNPFIFISFMLTRVFAINPFYN